MKPVGGNGAELEYELLGDGPELVWLHGIGGNLELERASAAEPARRFRAAARTHDHKALALRRFSDQGKVQELQLAALRIPTMVAGWDDDPITHPIALVRRIAGLIPGTGFEQIAPLADATHQEVADRVASCVLRWAG